MPSEVPSDEAKEMPLKTGVSGKFALYLVIGWLVFAWLWPPARRFREPGIDLIEDAAWATGMAILSGIALASIRRGPSLHVVYGYVALAICVLSIVVVMTLIVFRLVG
jgi:hypothetical protein